MYNWSNTKLQKDVGAKHGIYPEIIHLTRQLLRVVEFSDWPKMLIKFDKEKMYRYFAETAKSLEGDIFKP